LKGFRGSWQADCPSGAGRKAKRTNSFSKKYEARTDETTSGTIRPHYGANTA